MSDFIAIATWPFGQTAVKVAAELLRQGCPALDAVIAGAQAVEDDPTVNSVGFGGLPNAVGIVQLDACVMDGRTLSCGAVAALEKVRNPAALARRVMDQTPHVFLAGEGALLFAVQEGFPLQSLLTPESLVEWEKRCPSTNQTVPHASTESPSTTDETPLGHDTVTVLALDVSGSLAGACSTSGLAHKLPGRVGDSPLIGAGLYVDNAAGAAGATGVGEEIIRVGASLLVVEAMRAGRTPQEACEYAIGRVNTVAIRRGVHPARVAVIALDAQGQHGAACTAQTGFEYAIAREGKVELLPAKELVL